MSKKIEFSQEQRSAIYSNSNVLLSAGAGSGKTFVIIHHLIEIIGKEVLRENFDESRLTSFLKKICVITFTIKAAKELNERILQAVLDKKDESSRWELVSENLDHVFIGTIHSLCFHLLKESGVLFFDSEIISSIKYTNKIQKIFENFCMNSYNPFLIKNKKYFLNFVESLYSKVLLRLHFTHQFRAVENYSFIDLVRVFDIKFNHFVEGSGKWSIFVLALKDAIDSEDSLKLKKLLENTPRLPALKKDEKCDENIALAMKIKEFKKSFKEMLKITKIYEESKDQRELLSNCMSEFLNYLELKYWQDQYITYDDLEFLSLKNLEKFENFFSKIIVDEYQDLSWSQHKIVSALSKNAQKFFVGDHKQAIYAFRGGDLGVFEKTRSQIEKHLVLADNYRSSEKIIDFNNSLFSQMIKPYENQNTPALNENETQSEVTLFQACVEREDKFLSTEINSLEASFLVQEIKKSLEKKDVQTIAVIYRFLGPSVELFKLLVQENIPVKINMKAPLKEDPLLNLFKICMNYSLFCEEQQKKENLLKAFDVLNQILKLSPDSVEALRSYLEKFLIQKKILGTYYSFLNLLRSYGVSTIKLKESLEIIFEVLKLSQEKESHVIELLETVMKERGVNSIEITQNNKSVELISAHSSKGLEFDSVFVAGVMTNGRSKNSADLILDSSLEVRYLDNENQLQLSPQYFLRDLQNKIRDEKESSRLLYVSCSRAKKYLNFFLINHSKTKFDQKSWAQKLIKNSIETLVDQVVDVDFYDRKRLSSSPLFHEFNFLQETQPLSQVLLMPELSVAKMSKVSLCPYKFYLEEILKFNDQDLSFFDELKIYEKDTQSQMEFGSSSAERGLQIHDKIETMIKHIESVRAEELDEEILPIYKDLVGKENIKLLPEFDMRLELKGYTISGRADLIIEGDDFLEVWDFKTGKDYDEKSYLSQLLLYAYGYAKSIDIKKIVLKIVYIDLNKTKKWELKQKELVNKTYAFLNLFDDLSIKDLNQCEFCHVRSICAPGSE